jgi:acetoin utilization protein AcuB
MPKVKDLMTTDVVTIRADQTLRQAIEKMTSGNFRRIPVVDGETVVGIITDRDIRRALNSPVVFHERSADEYLLNAVTVGSSMTPRPLTVGPETPVIRVAELMEQRKIGGLPVVDGSRLVGIITVSDLITYLVGLLGSRSGARQ